MIQLSATTSGYSEYSTLALGTKGWQTARLFPDILNIKEFILYIQREHLFPLSAVVKIPLTLKSNIKRSKSLILDIKRDLQSRLQLVRNLTFKLDTQDLAVSEIRLRGEVVRTLNFALQINKVEDQQGIVNLGSEILIKANIQRTQEYRLYTNRSFEYVFEISVKGITN